jgi:hypothetical protein
MFSRKLAAPVLLTLCLVSLAACGAGRPVRQQRSDADSYHISRAELENSRVPTMYDAVQQLRPLWLSQGNDASVAVYLNDQLVGGVANLRRIAVHLTEDARYMSATEAQVRFGPNNGLRPAILVTIRR